MVNVYYYDLEVKQIYLVLLSPLAYAVWIEIHDELSKILSHHWSPLAYAVWIEIIDELSDMLSETSPLAYAVWIEITVSAGSDSLHSGHRLRMRCGSKSYQ